jgi:uncharacterized heparinase superfamily protein
VAQAPISDAIDPAKAAADQAGLDDASRNPVFPSMQDDFIAPLTGEAGAAHDGVLEAGRGLTLVVPALRLQDRLVRFAYGLGVPGPLLNAPFRKPQKERLIAAAEDSLPGDKVAGTAIRAGYFLLNGAKLTLFQADFSGVARMAQPMERYVHGFTWLADLEAAAPREQCVPVAQEIFAAWLEANCKPPARPGKLGAWSVGSVGTRLLSWLTHAPLILSGSKPLRQQAMAAISDHAQWLDRHVDRGEDVLAKFAGWCAIVAAGLLLSDGRPRRLYGEAGLVRTLGELVGDDGGVLSRSPLGQMEAIALLVRLEACYRAVDRNPPEMIAAMLAMLVPALLAMTHGDGSLGSWQGGWAIGSDAVSALITASGVRTRPLQEVGQWGYQRVSAQKSLLLFDAAPPPLTRHARAGCASTLALEFSHGDQRIFVNCGGAAAAGGLIPLRLETALRATAAHTALVLDDSNSTAVLINGKLGSGVNAVEIARRVIPGARSSGTTRLEASHDGYVSRFGLIHRRIVSLRDDGGELRGEDLLTPAKGKGGRGKVGFALRFHIGPGIKARVAHDRQSADLAMPDGTIWQFLSGAGEIVLEDSLWADKHARPVAIQQLVMQGLISRSGGSFAWLLKKMG